MVYRRMYMGYMQILNTITFYIRILSVKVLVPIGVLKLIPHAYQGVTNFYQLDHSILFKTFQY